MKHIKTLKTWKDVPGYEGVFQVNQFGEIRRLWKNNRITYLKGHKRRDGYIQVHLRYKGKDNKYLVHRLVAQAFVPNPDNEESVDHINTKKNDNRACNLQWLSLSENTKKQWRDSYALGQPVQKKLAQC